MAKIDFDGLKKLPPDERIKALKEIRAKLKKSKEDEEEELEIALEMLEEATEEQIVLDEIETPKVKEVKVKELFKSKSDLEEIAAQAKKEEKEEGLFTGAKIEQYTLSDSPVHKQDLSNIYGRDDLKENKPDEFYKPGQTDNTVQTFYKQDKTDETKPKDEFAEMKEDNTFKYKRDNL